MVTRQNGKTFAYSRQGKIIDTIDHILEDMEIPEGVTLDGELYCHGESLQTISSWAKRLQENTKKLKYVVYDVIDTGSGYTDRFHWLKERPFYQENVVELSPTFRLTKEVGLALKTVKAMKYEGLILREPKKPYEPGRRSSSLIKVKSCIDAEFPVVDIIPSADGWGILVCQMPNGNTFRVSAPGTIGMKTHTLEHKEDFIGRNVTVEFAEYTKDKVPFHCVATGWREDL
jgi:DNA ligase-1